MSDDWGAVRDVARSAAREAVKNDVEQAAHQAAQEAVKNTLHRLGIDADDEHSVQAQMLMLQRINQNWQLGKKAAVWFAVGAFISGAASGIWQLITPLKGH